MSETSDPIDSVDLDLSSREMGPMENQSGSNPIALDGSLPSIRSVSLVLQALLPLIVSLVLLTAGRRLYRFTTTVSVALSSALFTWALFVNLEAGQSIGNWTGEVAAVTVWSVMIGGSLIGALIAYQLTWWGAHVTGRLCLGANSGVGFAFSVLLIKSGLLIHSPEGQWSLVGASALLGILIVLWDHVMGPLVAISACGSFLFLLGTDMFNTLGLDGMAAGLRLLLDHNPDHSMYITSYNPPKSTIILIIVSWAIGLISFGFQYACYSVSFGPLPPTEDADEEQGLDSESKIKESLSEIGNVPPNTKKQLSQSEGESAATDRSQAVGANTDPNSNETSDGAKTSGTLIDSNRAPVHTPQEPSILPYLSSRSGSGPSGECRSPAALALSPSVYSRYRRTQDPIHKPPSRAPIQYQFHSNLISFTNPRRVETVDEVTESSASVLGVDPAARSSILTAGGASDAARRSNSMSEEYLNAMLYLASGECNLKEDDDQPEIVGSKSVDAQDNQGQRSHAIDDSQTPKAPISETSNAPESGDRKNNQASNSIQHSEAKVSITSSTSSPLDSYMIPIPAGAETSSSMNTVAIEFPSATQPPSAQDEAQDGRDSKNETTRPLNFLPHARYSNSGQEIRRSQQVQVSREGEEGSSGSSTRAGSSLSNAQTRCDEAHCSSNLLNQRSQDFAPQSGIGNAYSNREPDSSVLSETRSTNDALDGRHEVDAVDHKRFSHRPLPLTPSQQRPQSYDRSTMPEKQEITPKMAKVIDTRSLRSANSNGSSMLDSFLRVSHDSSVPTTPSSTGKALQEEQKQAESVSVPPRKRLSIITGKQAQLPRTTSTRTQNSQEAQIVELPGHSPTINSAVPHTPTLGNMLLRVSEGAEKLRKQSDTTDLSDPTENHQGSSNHLPIGEDVDDGDAATLRSEPSRRSIICMSSIYGADHTSAEDGGKSCSESEEDDRSHEQYFDPRRIQQLNKALGEWSNLFSDELMTEDGTEGSHTSGKKNGDINERSPSLHSIPLPSQQNKPGPSHAFEAPKSMNLNSIGATPFVGQPLAEVPWPQMRKDKANESRTINGTESQQKRWTTASSIFPSPGYESTMESPPTPHLSMESPPPPAHLHKNLEEELSDSFTSESGPDRSRMVGRRSRMSAGTLTSFEGAVSQKNQPGGMFCSASSHVADDHDMSDITSRVGETTDDEDRNYESAADYTKPFRPSGSTSLSAAEYGYLSAEDGNSHIDF